MVRYFLLALSLLLASCTATAPTSLYYWKTTLAWTSEDTAALSADQVDQVGLRLFDWGVRGEEGPLRVKQGLPSTLEVVPVVYATTDRLTAWARDTSFDPAHEADRLLRAMDEALAPAWSGRPTLWQLDADWSATTRDAWFAVVGAFAKRIHERGARLEVTVRLHQYRDRDTQGVPPADGGVLMLYGTGDRVLDPDLVKAYLAGPAYPLPLAPAFPAYTQVRQLNGYGRLVALHRLSDSNALPERDLQAVSSDRWEVVRRSTLGGRPLMAHDVLVIDRVTRQELETVFRVPAVEALVRAASGRVWWFDYTPGDKVPGLR